MQDALVRLRYRYWPDHLLGEILSKRWTETAIPVIVLLIVAVALARSIDGFLSPGSLADTARQAGEIGFVVLGMALVVIVGGIDLSVGSMFALCDFCALFFLNVMNWLAQQESLISIRPKDPDDRRIMLTEGQQKGVMLFALIGLPVVIFGLGVYGAVRRRK